MSVSMQSNQTNAPSRDSLHSRNRKIPPENNQSMPFVMNSSSNSLMKSSMPIFTLPSVQCNQNQLLTPNQTYQDVGHVRKVKVNHICLYSSLDSFFKALKANDLKNTRLEREFIRSQLNVNDAELNLILRNLEYTYRSRLSISAQQHSTSSSIAKNKLNNNIKSTNAFNLGKDLVSQVIKEGHFTPTTRTPQSNSFSSAFESPADIFRNNIMSQQPSSSSHMQMRESLQSQSLQPVVPPHTNLSHKRVLTSQTPTKEYLTNNKSLRKVSSASHLTSIEKQNNQRFGGSLRLSHYTFDDKDQTFNSPFSPTSSNISIKIDDDDFQHKISSVTPKSNAKLNVLSGSFAANSLSLYSDSGVFGLEEGSIESLSRLNTMSTSTHRHQTAKSKYISTGRLKINTKEGFFSNSDGMSQYKPKLKAIQNRTERSQLINQEREYLAMQYMNSIDRIKDYREKVS